MGQATIRDVARLAGVSVASVSRALNGLSNVRPEMRERVLAAAEELRFTPHAGARSLSLARAHAVGVVLPDLHGEFFSEILRGIDREVQARGYQLLLSNMHGEAKAAQKALATMRGRVDGLIVMAPALSADTIAAILPSSIPAVLVNSPETPERHLLRVDNRAGAAEMTRHLIAGGAGAVAHIRGPQDNLDSLEREQGYREAMAAHAPDQPLRFADGLFDETSGEAAALALIDRDPAIDSIFAANDMMALGALQGLRARGIAVPERVAVAGFDDVPLARYLSLTTMQVNMTDIGERSAARLIDAIMGVARPAAPDLITPTLIARGSTRS